MTGGSVPAGVGAGATVRPAPPPLASGPLIRGVLRFSLPLTAANLLQQSYLLADGIVVGRYVGVTAMAAVGVAWPLFYLFSEGFAGLATGFTIQIATDVGAGRRDRVPAPVTALIAFAAVLGAVCALAMLGAAEPMAGLLGVGGQTRQACAELLTVLGLGSVAVFGLSAVGAVLRALGDARVVMALQAAASLTNVLLLVVLVVLLGGGIRGAGAATVISAMLWLCVGLAVLFRRHRLRPRRPGEQWALIARAVRLGAPVSAQHVLIALGVMVLVLTVAPLGDAFLAGFTAVSRVETFVGMVFLDLSGGMLVLVAQSLGAARVQRVRQGLRRLSWLAVVGGLGVAVVLVPTRHLIAGAFTDDAAARQVIADYLLITCPFFWSYTLMVLQHGWLNGLGRTLQPLICTVVSFLLVRIPLSALLRPAHGAHGVIAAVVIGWLVGCGYTLIALRDGRETLRRADIREPDGPAPADPAQPGPIGPATR